MHHDPVRPSFLNAPGVRERAAERALSMEQLALELLPWARSYAQPAISNFPVGAIALGRSGAMYAGANLEFAGEPLSLSVHAEQAAVYNAWVHDEPGIALIASTATPCGLCRQFIQELPGAGDIRICVPDRPATTLADLLPLAFGPADLGSTSRLMQTPARPLALAHPGRDGDDDPVVGAALAAAGASYAPYSGTAAGVGLRTADGLVVQGRCAENAAFNPSLSAMQGAMIVLALAGRFDAALDQAVLVEASEPVPGRAGAGQWSATTAVLRSVAPGLRLVRISAVLRKGATMEGPGGLDSTDISALS